MSALILRALGWFFGIDPQYETLVWRLPRETTEGHTMTETTEADPFAGWFIDEADPDVGIFGDAVIHECDANVDGDAATTDVTIRANGEMVDYTTTFTCPVCTVTTAMTEQQPKVWFE